MLRRPKHALELAGNCGSNGAMSVENSTSPGYPQRAPRLVRIIRTRPRLFLSALLGLAVIALLFGTSDWRTATKLLAGWDIGVGLYLVLAFSLMARSDLHRIRRRAANQDEGSLAILVLTVAAAIASMAAIFAELATEPGVTRQPGQLILATARAVCSGRFSNSFFGFISRTHSNG